MRAVLALAVAVVVAGLAVLGWQRLEGTPPRVVAPESLVLGKAPRTLELELFDEQSGLRSASVRWLDPSGSKALADHAWPGSLLGGGSPESHAAKLEIQLDPAALQVPDGAATLVVDARDWSWRDVLGGNRSELSIPVSVDTRAPAVRVETGLLYVNRGGSALALYRLAEAVASDGVRVALRDGGEAFFPGFPRPGGAADERMALFSIPVDAVASAPVRVVAVDAAGNEGSARLTAQILEKSFRDSELSLSLEFIERVATPLATAAGLPTGDPVETFRGVNETLRARNEATIRERVASPAAEKLWNGPFEQLANSQVMSRFAEHRTYVFEGRPVSQARHYGFDLASTARAPVTAAGHGRVVFAGDLGIYGQCVIIDHGAGLASLYGHLSQIDVAEGGDVVRGQQLGLSGDTGLAGGDHLHFAFLVSGWYVDPLEWWDAKWVRTHVESELERPAPATASNP